MTNQRTDAYGGSLENRLRFPLEVFTRDPRGVAAGPADDGADLGDRLGPGGIDVEDAVRSPRAFAAAGADAIDVSTGQVSPDERPDFGRSYQTPFADAIRNRVDIATIAVGAISSYDDVNSLDPRRPGRPLRPRPGAPLRPDVDAARRARPGLRRSRRALARPLVAGRRKPQTGRTDGPKPRLTLIRELAAGRDASAVRHRRWQP